MLPYIIYILMTLVLSIIYDGKEDSRKKNFWYVLTCIYLVLLAGLRYGVGGDTQAYMAEFEYVPSSSKEYATYITEGMVYGGHMPGWTLLNLLCKTWFDSFFAVQLVQAAIVNICVFYVFKKYTQHIFLCALLYGITGEFFNFNTEVMREAIAIGVCSIGMYQYLRDNKVAFYILVALSVLCFHTSAAIVLLFPFVRIKKISVITLVVAFFSAFALWFVSDLVVSYLHGIFSDEGALSEKVISYSNRKTTVLGFLYMAIHYIIGQAALLYFAGTFENKKTIKDDDFSYYMSFYLILAILACGLSGFTRFMNYTIIFSLIMVTEFLSNIRLQLRKSAIWKITSLFIYCYFCILFYFTFNTNTNRYTYDFFIPYTSIYNENADIEFRYYMWKEAVDIERSSKNTRNL